MVPDEGNFNGGEDRLQEIEERFQAEIREESLKNMELRFYVRNMVTYSQ